ncbi:methylamine utilization protein [Photobacterium frigidiphilum]|uniref:Methylamine utilization protein n=1 Tax=Photobacterium frigidiphilum TaxID=264736 RepID=A0A2T3J9A3_9GAMM|nr:cytochrome c peroxidase [Photobacterium frigidiphilum]PSU45400.1 methylamine utilization protein [Photobacterium frigidiphilum]
MTRSKITKMAFKISARNKSKSAMLIASVGLAIGVSVISNTANAKSGSGEYDLTYLEEFGKRLFFENISDPKRMACASCHSPDAGGTNGHSQTNQTQVAVTGADPNGQNHGQNPDKEGGNPNPRHPNAGALKPPTNKYVQFLDEYGERSGTPNFSSSCAPFRLPCGGAFWNGRATGTQIEEAGIKVFDGLPDGNKYEEMYTKYLGPVADQAHASPFINPVEQGHKNKQATCEQVAKTKWGSELYYFSWGKELDCKKDTDSAFGRFAVALGAWQMSADNNVFNAKRDTALEYDTIHDNGKFPLMGLTDEENLGHDLFYGAPRPFGGAGAGCLFCHRSVRSGETSDGTDKFERYADDSYHNIGVPKNYEVPGITETTIPDMGVMFLTDIESHEGLHKTPTLRNVDQRPNSNFTKAFTHNGYFKTLGQLVHFYNTRDIKPNCEVEYGIQAATVEEAIANNCWPTSEYPGTTARGITGDLRLTPKEEAAIVAYLKTLTDTTVVKSPLPYHSSKYDESRLSHTYLPKP